MFPATPRPRSHFAAFIPDACGILPRPRQTWTAGGSIHFFIHHVTSPDLNFTKLLSDAQAGVPGAADALFPAVYDTLRNLARRHLAAERIDHTLQPTALVHEAYLKLTGSTSIHFNDRGHFFRVATQAMRRILIDHAKARGRSKRNGRLKVELIAACEVAVRTAPEDMLSIDEAICRLEQTDPDAAAVVRMRFFIGLSLEEMAGALDMSVSSVRREWAYARAFLFRELCDEPV
jgi:RNA polymerase sigma factor (TIGR02999 family)